MTCAIAGVTPASGEAAGAEDVVEPGAKPPPLDLLFRGGVGEQHPVVLVAAVGVLPFGLEDADDLEEHAVDAHDLADRVFCVPKSSRRTLSPRSTWEFASVTSTSENGAPATTRSRLMAR